MHVRDGDWHVKPKLPIIPGHEGAGVVVQLGEGVTTLKLGDRVGHAWLHDSCGGCDYCLSGWETVCGHQHQTGFAANGCFAEYTVAEAKYVGRIPDEVSFSQAWGGSGCTLGALVIVWAEGVWPSWSRPELGPGGFAVRLHLLHVLLTLRLRQCMVLGSLASCAATSLCLTQRGG
jgi:hypothetical protein